MSTFRISYFPHFYIQTPCSYTKISLFAQTAPWPHNAGLFSHNPRLFNNLNHHSKKNSESIENK